MQHAVGAVRSVAGQTHRPIEFIVVDGTATDDVLPEIEGALQEAPPGVTVQVVPKKNCNAAQAMNAGLLAARGEYVALLDADDRYAPDRLARCLAASGGAGIVVTYLVPVDGDGHRLRIGDRWRADYERILSNHIAEFPSLSCLGMFMDIVATPGNLFIHREILARVGGFSEFPRLHYLDFFLRASLQVEPSLIREKLLVHCVQSDPAPDCPVSLTEEHAEVIRKHLLRLISGERPANPLADVFRMHPFLFGQTIWTEAVKRAFDGLLEYRDPPPDALTAGDARPAGAWRTEPTREFTLVTHELTLTGAPVIVLELASLLRERGCRVTVLSLIDGPLKPEFTKRGIRVKTPPLLLERVTRFQAKAQQWAFRHGRLPERVLHWLARTLREFTEWVWQMRLWSHARGILVVNSVASWPLALKLPGGWKGPAFWYIHESIDPQWRVPGARANARLKRLVEAGRLTMLYGSDATRLHWAGNNFNGQVRYWSGISRSADDPYSASDHHEIRQNHSRRVILNVGSVSGRKGTRTLVEAFALGRAEGWIPGDVELCIVGCALPSVNPEARDLILRVLQPDLSGHVRVVHSVLPGALPSYYREAAVYAHASIFDCMPIALLSAMAHGLPIVTTDADGCKEAILHESCGLLVQPGQVRQMALALGTLLTQPDKARALGDAARARFVDRFCVEATFEPLYDTLVGRASGT